MQVRLSRLFIFTEQKNICQYSGTHMNSFTGTCTADYLTLWQLSLTVDCFMLNTTQVSGLAALQQTNEWLELRYVHSHRCLTHCSLLPTMALWPSSHTITPHIHTHHTAFTLASENILHRPDKSFTSTPAITEIRIRVMMNNVTYYNELS